MARPYVFPAERLSAFQAKTARIERAFSEGGITPAARQRLLEIARDECGVTALTSRAERTGIPIDAIRSDEEVRQRRRNADSRRRRKQAVRVAADARSYGRTM